MNYRPFRHIANDIGNILGKFTIFDENESFESESFAADKYGILGHVGDGNFHIGMLTFQIPNSVLFKKTFLEC